MPMSGLAHQLTTLMDGSHITPSTYDVTSGKVIVLPDAMTIGAEIGMEENDFLAMGSDIVALTPFASLVDIPANN